jgi:phospholipid-translocating ATPase
MAVACAIVDSELEKDYYPKGAPWLYSDNKKDDNPSINGLVTWAFALITSVSPDHSLFNLYADYYPSSFQNIVPISLYISVEAVRTCQAAFIYFDKDIWYEKTNQAAVARSWNLSDDLGQIEYIFSDKTGTLTQVRHFPTMISFCELIPLIAYPLLQNSMIFRQCSIGGKVYRGDQDLADEEDDGDDDEKRNTITSNVRISETKETETSSATGSAYKVKGEKTAPELLQSENIKPPPAREHIFHDESLKHDLADAVSADPKSENASHARNLNGFFTVLALCHTVLTSVDPMTGAIAYKAQSLDEAALVQAAADVGFVFHGRDREALRLKTPFSEELEKYELLNILEFTSARKRMSVVLKKLDDSDGRLFLLTKGADNVIFERLKPGSEELKNITEKQLDDFANEGLRTLTLAYKVIPGEHNVALHALSLQY